MANFKKLLSLIMISAIFIALLVWTFVSYDVRNPFFAFFLNWLIMSWMAMMGQVVPLPSLPSTYHEIKPFEQSGKVYEKLGVSLFKKIVRQGPLRILSPTLRFPAKRTVPALRHLENEMCKADTSHLMISFVVLLFMGYALFKSWFDTAAWLLLL